MIGHTYDQRGINREKELRDYSQGLSDVENAAQHTVGELATLQRGTIPQRLDLVHVARGVPVLMDCAERYADSMGQDWLQMVRTDLADVTLLWQGDAASTVAFLQDLQKQDPQLLEDAIQTMLEVKTHAANLRGLIGQEFSKLLPYLPKDRHGLPLLQ